MAADGASAVDGILELFCGLEDGHALGGDGDGLAGSGVLAGVRVADLAGEDAEAGDIHAVAGAHDVGKGVGSGGDHALDVGLLHVGRCCQSGNKLALGHGMCLLSVVDFRLKRFIGICKSSLYSPAYPTMIKFFVLINFGFVFIIPSKVSVALNTKKTPELLGVVVMINAKTVAVRLSVWMSITRFYLSADITNS